MDGGCMSQYTILGQNEPVMDLGMGVEEWLHQTYR